MVQVSMHTCGLHAYMHACMHAHIHTRIVSDAHTHTHAHTHNAHTHTCIHTDGLGWNWNWYTVLEGDTLSAIASRHAVPLASIVALNTHTISSADAIYAGQTLRIPCAWQQRRGKEEGGGHCLLEPPVSQDPDTTREPSARVASSVHRCRSVVASAPPPAPSTPRAQHAARQLGGEEMQTLHREVVRLRQQVSTCQAELTSSRSLVAAAANLTPLAHSRRRQPDAAPPPRTLRRKAANATYEEALLALAQHGTRAQRVESGSDALFREPVVAEDLDCLVGVALVFAATCVAITIANVAALTRDHGQSDCQRGADGDVAVHPVEESCPVLDATRSLAVHGPEEPEALQPACSAVAEPASKQSSDDGRCGTSCGTTSGPGLASEVPREDSALMADKVGEVQVALECTEALQRIANETAECELEHNATSASSPNELQLVLEESKEMEAELRDAAAQRQMSSTTQCPAAEKAQAKALCTLCADESEEEGKACAPGAESLPLEMVLSAFGDRSDDDELTFEQVRPTLLRSGFTPQQCEDILREILQQAADDAAPDETLTKISKSHSQKALKSLFPDLTPLWTSQTGSVCDSSQLSCRAASTPTEEVGMPSEGLVPEAEEKSQDSEDSDDWERV